MQREGESPDPAARQGAARRTGLGIEILQPRTKKAPAQGGRQSLRQVSYRQETYRAVTSI
jgi:hypothetical protein